MSMFNTFGKICIVIAFVCSMTISALMISSAKADGVVNWDGNGSEKLPCEYGGHWNLIPGDGVTGATLYVNGVAYPMNQHGGGAWEAYSDGYLPADPLPEVHASYTGEGNPNLQVVLSHCVEGDPTPTPTFTMPPPPTDTPTPTSTPVITDTPTSTPTSTPVITDTPTTTPTSTPTDDPGTPTPTSTGTLFPTDTPTTTPTSTGTPVHTYTPTLTSTGTPVHTSTPTQPYDPTETPKPPNASVAFDIKGNMYPGELLGSIWMDDHFYKLYAGVNAPDGSLLLPSAERGGAFYLHTIWVHRAWNTGWLNLEEGSKVKINADGKSYTYRVAGVEYYPYGTYFENNFSGKYQYIATCYSGDSHTWTGIQLFKLQLMSSHRDLRR